MDRIDEVHMIERKISQKICVVPGYGLPRFKQLPDLTICGQKNWSMSKAAHKKVKREWAIEKPKPDDARKLRGRKMEYKETIKKNARTKLERSIGRGFALQNGNEDTVTWTVGNRKRDHPQDKSS